ncbi:MAG TPA: ATP-binding protein [Gemmatimonadota bacterium]|nr:ATP-binding protein [Gemmatimonadota bacterium]
MKGGRPFRLTLAGRFAVAMAIGLGAMALLAWLAIRATLDRQIEASLVNVASLQAASITEPPGGQMRIREWEITPEEAASIRDINRWTQVWSADGESLLRSRHLTQDLPLDGAALDRAGEGEIAWSEQTFGGEEILSLYYPLGRLGRVHDPHVLQVAATLASRNATLRDAGLLLLGIVVVATVMAFAGAWWLARQAILPVTAIVDQAEEIGAGTLKRRIAAHAYSLEYQRLVEVLNDMLERLDAAFESQRRFTADASHELRSPLTALRGELELARRRERSPQEYRRVIDSVLEEVERLSRTADDLLTLARSDARAIQPRLKTVQLGEAVRGVVRRMESMADAKRLDLQVASEDGPTVLADPDLLDRLVRNLLENAIKYTPSGGRVAVRADREEKAGRVTVEDTGPGIPESEIDRIFERFHRVDDSRTPERDGGGAGLGLAIARSIADLHQGSLSAENRTGGGIRFVLRLPLFSA